MSANNSDVESGSRRASLRVQQNGQETNAKDRGSQQNGGPTRKIVKQEPDVKASESLQLAELVRDNYAVLSGDDNEQKLSIWEDIFNECKVGLNHGWAQERDVNFLRNSKWTKMKWHALDREKKGTNTEVDKLVLSFIKQQTANNGLKKEVEDGDETEEVEEEKGKPSVSTRKKRGARRQVVRARMPGPMKNSASGEPPKSAIVEGTAGVRTRRSMQQQQLLAQHPSVPPPMPNHLTPPESRQSSQRSTTTTDSAPVGPTTRRAIKRRASTEFDGGDNHHGEATTSAAATAGVGQSASELSALEKQLVQARMRLCEAKARVNEEEANVHRLEKAQWEEMLKTGKMAKIPEE